MLAPSRSGLAMLARGLSARIQPAACQAAVLRSFATGGDNSDMHDDFKPQFKAPEQGGSVEAAIKDDIASTPVLLYMKGHPEAPMCGFSNMACQILTAYGVDFESRNVLADPELREAIKKFSGWPTIPQLYVKGEFVGGSDIMMGMHQSGDLKALLADGPAEESSSSH